MIHTSGAELELSKLCMLQLDDATQRTCHRVMERLDVPVPSPPQTKKTGVSIAVVGGVFAGGFAVGILISVTVVVV